MGYYLYLDDFREPMESFDQTNNQLYLLNWVVVRNYDEFVSTIIEKGIPEAISFDHDIYYDDDDFPEKTGYDCAKWFIDYCIKNKQELPTEVLIHSANTAGSIRIKSLFTEYYKYKRI